MNGYVLKFLSDSINAAFSRYLTVAFTSFKTDFLKNRALEFLTTLLQKANLVYYYQVLIDFLNKPLIPPH